ncbi:MAG: SUMF1/EgtB/PvdO family nonheme iron enzyme [Opitutales bacterium]
MLKSIRILFLFSIGSLCSLAKTVYVDDNISAGGNGTSWASAHKYLQDALTEVSEGDEIWVAEGSYRPDQGAQISEGNLTISFNLVNGVGLYGGFNGTETERKPLGDANKTILSGEMTQTIFIDPPASYSVQSLSMQMIWCPPGNFTMGSPTSEPGRGSATNATQVRGGDETQHNVTLLKGFYLAKYELTQSQYQSLMQSNPSVSVGNSKPVESIDWEAAKLFCDKLTEIELAAERIPKGWAFELPTEAEWEYACRAGTTSAYSWGSTINTSRANYADNNRDTTLNVGSYSSNPWGFHDMHGNVWEWVADWYGSYGNQDITNPVGPSGGTSRVNRGGSFVNLGTQLRSAYREADLPSSKYEDVGLRVALKPVDRFSHSWPEQIKTETNYIQTILTGIDLNSSTLIDGFFITKGRANSGFRRGGGLILSNAKLSLRNCSFSENNSGYDGGAVYATNSQVNFSDCLFQYNSTGSASSVLGRGGAIYAYNSDLTFSDTELSENNASQGGGAIYADNTKCFFSKCSIKSNNAKNGAGIYIMSNKTDMVNCALYFNSASSEGGAIFNRSDSSTFTNCVFWNNVSLDVAGAILNTNTDNDPEFVHCLFTSNIASSDGATFYNYGSKPKIINSIIWKNNSAVSTYHGIFPSLQKYNLNPSKYSHGMPVFLGKNIVQDWTDENVIDQDPGFLTVTGNRAGPDNVLLTADDAFRLSSSSPALDVGSKDLLPNDLADLDEDGNRTEKIPFDSIGDFRIKLAAPDLGPYEFGENVKSEYFTVETGVSTGGLVSGGGIYLKKSSVSLRATPTSGYKFDKWSGDHLGNDNPTQIVLLSDMNVTANFSLISYQVTAAAQPSGSGQVSGSGSFHYEDNVSLTALPNSEYRFLQWEGNFTGSKTANPLTLSVTEDLNVTASFELIPYFSKSGTDLGNGWRSIDWFGTYCVMNASDWIYHLGYGWIYMIAEDPSSVWFYYNKSWKWTNSTVYPFAHDHSSNSWLYFQSTEEGMHYYDYNQERWSNGPYKLESKLQALTISSACNLEMIWVEPGTFTMGSPESEEYRSWDEDQYEVTLTNGFYLGKYEVTQEQYKFIMEGNKDGVNPSPNKYDIGPQKPVTRIWFNDTQRFLYRLNDLEKTSGRIPEEWSFTLPTEAEWEYACRAGSKTAYSWGDTVKSTDAHFEYGTKLKPVGSYSSNAWGFHDMHGNAAEFVADWWGMYPTGSVSDPKGAINPAPGRQFKILRGGSKGYYGNRVVEKSHYMRSANREDWLWAVPEVRGFRVSLKKEKFIPEILNF